MVDYHFVSKGSEASHPKRLLSVLTSGNGNISAKRWVEKVGVAKSDLSRRVNE